MGIVILTLVALLLGILIVLIESKLKEEDIKDDYEKRLPGINCGACGFGSCKGMALAMLEDVNNYKKCRPLRGDKLKEMEEFLNKNKEI